MDGPAIERAAAGLPKVRIGASIEVFPVGPSPMAGYTDSAMRTLCLEFGAGLALTEVANAEAVARGARPTLHLLHSGPAERPLGAHIYGAKPDVMAAAACRIESLGRFDFIDINAGCPVRKIVAKGAGAALIRQPRRIEAIVGAVAKAVSLPVTLKTRIGWDPGSPNVRELVAAAEQGGASMVIIHARFASAKHSGPAHWNMLAAARESAGIPVFGNGGVETAGDVFRMIRETGVDGVLIGRAAVGHPWIFRDVRDLADGREPRPLTFAEIRATALEQLARMIRLKQIEYAHRRRSRLSVEHAAVLQLRGHLARYLAGSPGWPRVRRRLQAISSVADVESCLADAYTPSGSITSIPLSVPETTDSPVPPPGSTTLR
jgi:nifR3 family TIM-barrel protein